jgi:hypothetical protein
MRSLPCLCKTLLLFSCKWQQDMATLGINERSLRNTMNPEKLQRELADEEAILVEYKEQLKRAIERVNEQEARLRLLREVLALEMEEQSASTDK